MPIINENDTVSVEELQTTFGDNDRLAAMVTNLIRAPLLVLLSDVDGLYDGDPRSPGAKLISTITRSTIRSWHRAADVKTGMSKGGMASKLVAARKATVAGENVVIASGKQPGNLARILAGEPVGTLVVAQGSVIASRKHGSASRLKHADTWFSTMGHAGPSRKRDAAFWQSASWTRPVRSKKGTSSRSRSGRVGVGRLDQLPRGRGTAHQGVQD